MHITDLLRKNYFFPDALPLSVSRFEYQSRTDLWHRHLDFAELVIAVSGTGYQETASENRLIKPGSLIFMPPGSVHRYANINNFVHYNVLIGQELLDFSQTDLLTLPGYKILWNFPRETGRAAWLRPEDLAQLVGILETIRQEIASQSPGWQTAAKADYMRAIVFISRHAVPEEPKSAEHSFQIGNLLHIMEKRCREKITLQELATLAGMSVSRFRHRFMEIVGISPIDYLIRLRLRCVLNMLITSASLDTVAWTNGFTDRNYMARQFKRHIGMSPRDFRHHYEIDNSTLGKALRELEKPFESTDSSI